MTATDPCDLPDLERLYARHDEETRMWREERRSSGDTTIAWELSSAERKHFQAQQPVEFSSTSRPRSGTIVVDKDGDAWEFGRTRWTQISGNESKHLRVPGLQLPAEFAPYRIIGRTKPGGDPTEWAFRTIRPMRRRG